MLLEKVKAILLESCGLPPHKRILLGVSGGADSMVLLDVLVRCGYQPVVAHFNHQLRPTAGADAGFVRQRTADYGLEFISGTEDVSARAQRDGQGIEEAARSARYQFLFSAAQEYHAAGVAVAHQADDQVETVLMNLLRGSGLNGLTGMRYRSLSPFHETIPLIRPLLDCWREEILTYCQENALVFVNDESNRDSAYRRNRIRLELLPALETYNPQVKSSLHQMAALLSSDMDFIDETCQEALAQVSLQSAPGYAEIDLRRFALLPKSIQRYSVKVILANTFPAEMDLGALHFETARQVLAREVDSLNVQLNDVIVVRVENERGVFMTVENSSMPSAEWPCIQQEIRLPTTTGVHVLACGWTLSLEVIARAALEQTFRNNQDNLTAFLALEKLGPELRLRTWLAGDRYQPLGMHGKSLKLSDFWINHKVPLRAKGHWPLIFSNQELVWVPGFPPSQIAKVTQETRDVLKLRVYRAGD